MAHYYTDNIDLASKREQFDYCFGNEKFIFTTDIGVFSKKDVDFGSHLLLKTLYQRDLGTDILDLGCGWGPIGIILKRFDPKRNLTLVDVNSRAVELAELNASLNKVNLKAFVCEDIESLQLKFNTVTLNPPIRAGKVVVYALYEKSHAVLNDGGSLFIVIQKKQGAASSVAKLKTLFRDVIELSHGGGYHVYQAIK